MSLPEPAVQHHIFTFKVIKEKLCVVSHEVSSHNFTSILETLK